MLTTDYAGCARGEHRHNYCTDNLLQLLLYFTALGNPEIYFPGIR